MPHIIAEYSKNLEQRCDMRSLIEALHQSVLATGLGALDALRTRAEPRDLYVIADGAPQNGFLAITARLAPGRSSADQQRLLNALLGSAEVSLGDAAADVMLSAEYQEINPDLRINKNNLRDAVAARSAV